MSGAQANHARRTGDRQGDGSGRLVAGGVVGAHQRRRFGLITAYDLFDPYRDRCQMPPTKPIPPNGRTQDNAWTTTGGGDLLYACSTGLTNGTEYDVQVRARERQWRWGLVGLLITGTPELSEKTRATIVAVRGDDGAVAVTWNAPTETVVIPHHGRTHVRYILTSADESVDTNWTVDGRRLDT